MTLEGVTAELLVVTKIIAPGRLRCVRGKRECAVCGVRLVFITKDSTVCFNFGCLLSRIALLRINLHA